MTNLTNRTLEPLIRQYVNLMRPNTKGWHSCVHIGGCDRGHKGPRSAFLFDGDTTAFNCFNCGVSTVYDPTAHTSMPNPMIQVLKDFNVPEDEWKQVILAALAFENQGNQKSRQKSIYKDIEPKKIELPDHFYPLDIKDKDDKWVEIAKDYLEYVRGINPESYPFFLSTGQGDKQAVKWKGRLIIPIYKDEKLIYYQGRALINMQKKYLSPSLPKNTVLFGFDKLFENTTTPLYVVEGWFDAYAIDGVAIFGNQLSQEQITWLNRCKRPKVIIPDRFGDGHRLANQAITLGWNVATPAIANCKDTSAAVKRFGKLYVIKSIIDNTMSGFMAQTATEIYCKNGQNQGKKKNKKTRQGKRRS